MSISENVPLMISLPKPCRDKLRKIAAEKNLSNPDEVMSAARLVREIVVRHLDSISQEDHNHENRPL